LLLQYPYVSARVLRANGVGNGNLVARNGCASDVAILDRVRAMDRTADISRQPVRNKISELRHRPYSNHLQQKNQNIGISAGHA
jgi:hypothetical protein